MLIREKDFALWLGLTESEKEKLNSLALEAAQLAKGMTDFNDYFALGAFSISCRPGLIFEIGTYLGVTANFLLKLLPDVRVVSVAYVNPPRFFWGKRFNNSELNKRQVGSAVDPSCRYRFTQLYGDSHQLSASDLVERFGKFDLVFVDGDHRREGVESDTELANNIIGDGGAICWHDANPKQRYQDVRDYLEDMKRVALATYPDYVGGVACWSKEIELKLLRLEEKTKLI